MQRLHHLCSLCIPRVLLTDLVPSASWRWFLLEDAGNVDQSALPSQVAVEAARTLGRLQQRALADQALPSLLIPFTADQLQQQAVAVSRWAMKQQNPEVQAELQRIISRLEQAHAFFGELAEQLCELPSTLVHGDFWSGNIALAGNTIRFIDWGDALWGAGGISIVKLLMTSGGQLDNAASQVWAAYEQGWGRPISPVYQRACQTATELADLMIDQAIAISCGRGPERLRGLVPGLRELEALLARPSPW